MADRNGQNINGIEKLLISLLDSPSFRKNNLLLLLDMIPTGHHPLPYMERITDPVCRLLLRNEYAESLNEIKLKYDLRRLMRKFGGKMDLEMGSFLISRFSENYNITPEKFSHSLDVLAQPLKKRLQEHSENSIRKIEIFSGYIFGEKNFRGNRDDCYNPSNLFLSDVMDTGLGNALSLSVLSILIGRRTGILFRGVNMPGHFIIRTEADGEMIYLDPFNGGNILSEGDCSHDLKINGFVSSPGARSVVDDLFILKKMYRNLIHYHSEEGDYRREMTLRQHFSILDDSSMSH